MGIFRYYDLGISEVFIFDNFFINQIREGVVVTPDHNEAVRAVIDEHFTNRKVVYISNRHFSYTVDPLTYMGTSEIHNLIAIAIVSEEPLKRTIAEYESQFYNRPFRVFKSLSHAMEWVREVLND